MRFLIWSLVIGLLPIFMFGVLIVDKSESELRKSAIQTLEAAAETKVQLIEAFGRERVRDISSLAKMPGVRRMLRDFVPLVEDGGRPDSNEYGRVRYSIYGIVRQFTDEDSRINMVLVSTRNQLVWASVYTNQVGNFMDASGSSLLERTVRQAVETDGAALSSIELSEAGSPELWTAAPVYEEDGTHRGFVAVQIDLDALFDITSDFTGLGETGDVVLGVLDGDTVTILNRPRFEEAGLEVRQVTLGTEHTRHIQEAVRQRERVDLAQDYRLHSTLGVSRYLATLDLGLVVKVDEAEAFAPIAKLKEAVGIASILAVLLVLLGAGAVSRWFTRPIVQVTNATREIAEGHWDKRVEINGSDEIAVLGQSLNHMTDSLQRTTAALKRSHDELEGKVEARTAELQEQESRLALALEAANAGFWKWDLATNGVIWSERCRAMFGVQPDVELCLDNFYEGVHPEDRERVREKLEVTLRSGVPYVDEFRSRDAEGRVRWIEALGQLVSSDDGEPLYMTGLAVDITHTRLAEEARRRSEKWLSTAISSAPFPMIIHAEDGDVLQVSQSWLDITGYSREELSTIGEWTLRAYGSSKGREAEDIQKLYDTSGPVNEGEYKVRTKSGETVVWEFSSTALPPLADGRRVVLSMAKDQTERHADEEELKRYSQELERSNRELDQFAYIASHDLKAPLRAIDNLAKWIAEDLADALTEQSASDMALLRQRVRRMEGLLDSLLQYSRIGRLKEERSDVDVHQLVEELIDLQQRPGFVVEIEGKLPTLKAPKGALNRIFGNLIANAMKHHDKPEGHVVVRHRVLEDAYEFEVEDDGPGIPDKFHRKVFEMFQTLKPRDEMEGSGIGLSLVQKTLQTHRGSIEIVSGTPGKTILAFRWPK